MADQAHSTGTATSRAHTLRPAARKATKARLALSGPSGSGKTWTALSIAEVLAPGGRYVIIDTEPSDDNNTAAELYADRFAFDLIDWTQPPFDPRDLTLTIKQLGDQGIDVLIVDSASAFWRGEGGTLDIADGRFGGWRVGTPAQNQLIDAILRAPMHVIFCTRAKQAYAVEEKPDGRQKVTKLGLEPIQRADIEYEFQVVGMIDNDHRIDIGKTRCADLAGLSFVANKQGELAAIYRDWLAKGLALITQTDADLLTSAFGAIDDADERKTAKAAFVAAFGRPAEIETDRLADAWTHVAAATGVPVHRFTPDRDDETACADCGLGRRAGWHDSQAEPAPPPPGDETPPTGTDETVREAQTAAEGLSDDAEAPFAPAETANRPGPTPEQAAAAAEAEAALEAAEAALDRRREIIANIDGTPPAQVRERLVHLGLDASGSARQARDRLIDHLWRAETETADATA